MLWVADHRSTFTTCAHRTPGPVLRQCGKLGLIKTVQHTAQGTQECRQTHVRGNTRLDGVLRTVAALSGTAACEIRAWDCVATNCVDRWATDPPDSASLSGRL
jgi:hypothetical protein